MRKINKRTIFIILILILTYLVLKNFSGELNANNKFVQYIVDHSNNVVTNKKKSSYFYLSDIFNIENVVNSEYKHFYSKKTNNEIPVLNEKISKPLVYIYNTHQGEKYALPNNEPYNITPTVMTTSYMLEEQLSIYGINSIVEEKSVSKILNENNWNYASSYRVTRGFLNDIIKDEPSLRFFIDVHRDSVKKSITTVKIGDTTYARILFVIGLENKEYEKNLEMVEYINNEIEKKYPGLSRGIYKKKGKNVNGVYNQDFSNNCMLIEFGGQENTVDEIYNTVEVLGKILADYIGERYEK